MAQRADGSASILAIGKATPENFLEQSTYPDYFFRVTNSQHLIDLKKKFQRICDKTSIRKRHFILNEELITKNPCLSKFMENSINTRLEIYAKEIQKLAVEAATKAIQEWGQPKSCITHLIFSTLSDPGLPCGDYHLLQTLGLSPNIERVVILQHGCFAGGTMLRLAKCLAESHKGARVLVVSAETTTMLFRGPSEEHQEDLITQALFADGASALIVGVNPNETIGERASFVITSASQVILPNSSHAITGHLSEGGIKATIHKDVPNLLSNNIGKILEEAFTPLGISNWNSIFWVVHPGGRAILDQLEERVGLKPEKLMISRHVLAEYGNLMGVCVHFVLDEMRKRSIDEGNTTTGEGLEWGVLLGFGLGVTIETIVLQSVSL
ncbi:Bibenzyl synthase [Dendrobium catenatum]|uniref:chalcone synthase n=1 Tax=Dendrobium catenatum TaxID=906689 RepID=A0A2I0W6U2_9ASPA|nr:Bibenzyl synthase [Dendrobium catenatum]